MKDTTNNETNSTKSRTAMSTTRLTTSLFASNLRFLLQRNGMTAKELSSKIGLSEQTISGWMNGKKNPRPGTITDIANFFGVQFVDLFDQNGNAGILPNTATTADVPIQNVGVASKTSYAVTANATKPTFAIIAPDDSMLPIVQKGDVVLYAELPSVPKDGSLVVVTINGTSTVRRAYHAGEFVTFTASSGSYTPATYKADSEEYKILGKAVSIQRNIENA